MKKKTPKAKQGSPERVPTEFSERLTLFKRNPAAEKIINDGNKNNDLGFIPERIGGWMPENYEELKTKDQIPAGFIMPTAEVYLAFILDEIEVQNDELHAGSSNKSYAGRCKKWAKHLQIVANKLVKIGVKPAPLPWAEQSADRLDPRYTNFAASAVPKKRKFQVMVRRTETRFISVNIEERDLNFAQEKALKDAPNLKFESSGTSHYAIEAIQEIK